MNAQEILSQSDDEYMNESQLRFFTKLLVDKKEALLSRLREYDQSLKSPNREADPGDVASNEEHRSISLTMMTRDREELKNIYAALDRLEAGDYGYCDHTGEPIGLRRLMANPTTQLSVESMRAVEAKKQHLA